MITGVRYRYIRRRCNFPEWLLLEPNGRRNTGEVSRKRNILLVSVIQRMDPKNLPCVVEDFPPVNVTLPPTLGVHDRDRECTQLVRLDLDGRLQHLWCICPLGTALSDLKTTEH